MTPLDPECVRDSFGASQGSPSRWCVHVWCVHVPRALFLPHVDAHRERLTEREGEIDRVREGDEEKGRGKELETGGETEDNDSER